MDTENLKIYLEIAKLRNISAAAKSLSMTQSTVSRRLQMLEDELHTRLVVRNRGVENITLTPAGEQL
ncbi:MAG TPA: LysR family transcriptional regulator, partial [Oribacterium sp.]|nr:LysR family transcriptional regulator [Oribacterium sp.]